MTLWYMTTAEADLPRARRWLAWLWQNAAPGQGYLAPWIEAVDALNVRPGDVEMEVLSQCDGLVLCGSGVNGWMNTQRDAAQRCGLQVLDLTGLGEEPPDTAVSLATARARS